jgi:hypothetical protein
VIALLLAGAVLVPDAIASAVRDVFAQVTLGRLLVVGAALVPAAAIAQRTRLARAGRYVDRIPWPAAVALVSVVFGVVWYALGRATTLPRVFGDELTHAELARGFAENGSLSAHGYGSATAAVNALVYRLTDGGASAYHAIQAINAAVMATAALPAYLLARRALPHRWALAVAALTVAAPWLSYSSLVMTEALFYPVFLWFALALARALERPTKKRQAVLVLALAAAYVTRTQAVVLGAAVVSAVLLYGWRRGTTRRIVRAFLPTWLLYLVPAFFLVAGSALGAWRPLGAYGVLAHGWWHPHGLVLWTAANVTALSLGLGVLTALAAPLGVAALLRREASEVELVMRAQKVNPLRRVGLLRRLL